MVWEGVSQFQCVCGGGEIFSGLSWVELDMIRWVLLTAEEKQRWEAFQKERLEMITPVMQAKEGWEDSHQKEDIMTGMMTEKSEGERGEGRYLMESNRRLEDVYMFVLEGSSSPSLGSVTVSRQNAFIRVSWGSPWENTLSARQHRAARLPTVSPQSPPQQPQEESNSHEAAGNISNMLSQRSLKRVLSHSMIQ